MLAAATNCCRISPEADVANSFVCRFSFVFWHSSKNYHLCEYYRLFDFAWASCIFRIFVVRAALVRFLLGPVDREKFLSYFTKNGRSVLKETINQSYFMGSWCEAFPVRVCTSKGVFYTDTRWVWEPKVSHFMRTSKKRVRSLFTSVSIVNSISLKGSPPPNKKKSLQFNASRPIIWLFVTPPPLI